MITIKSKKWQNKERNRYQNCHQEQKKMKKKLLAI